MKRIDSKYNDTYLYAEYNHAVHTTQMAVKWQDFVRDGDDYNLQYRTAGDERVREAHIALDGVTLPPSDKFWDRYLPPNGWNCRCTVVQVMREDFPLSDSEEAIKRGDESTQSIKQQMFRFNPGKTLELFPPKHPYLPKGCGSCTRKLLLAYDPEREECRACGIIRSQARIESNRRLYEKLKDDDRYVGVEFDEQTGGLMATHRGHNTHPNDNNILIGGMTGDELEKHFQRQMFKTGHSVVFCDESKQNASKQTLSALDMVLDGVVMDLASVTKHKKHYGSVFTKKNKQLGRYNRRSDVTIESNTVCVYFYEPTMYSRKGVIDGIDYLKSKVDNMRIKHIVCVINEANGIEIERYDT